MQFYTPIFDTAKQLSGRIDDRVRSGAGTVHYASSGTGIAALLAPQDCELEMLGDTDAVATVAVRDITTAPQFYEGKLGLKKLDSPEKQVLLYQSGSSRLLVYLSQFAGTNQATAVTWAVEDVDREVIALKEKGVTFERYDFPGMTHEGDVHVMGKRRNAWLKDPDGNILSIVNR